MAATDKRTLLRDAVRFVQKGQLDKAIGAYRAIAKVDPKDSKVRNELGDLYIKQGKKKEAIAEYLETAGLYEKDGFALRAIALCQKILNLDPELTPVRLKLGDLYAVQRLVAEARAQYLHVANVYDKKGQVADALDVFRRIADLEPENVGVRVKLAGMFEKQKFPEKAAVEYVRAARGSLAKGDAVNAVKLFVRAFKLHPANLDARRGIAEFHRERKDWPVLVGLLQPLVVRGTRELDLVVLYGEALSHVGHAPEAARVLEKVREREPNSVAVNLALGRALLVAGDTEGGIAALHRCVGLHIAESRFDEADALLQEMSAAAPCDERLGQRILELAQKRGDKDGIAAAYLRVAEIHEGNGLVRAAAGAIEKYLELRPGDADAEARLAALQGQAPERPAAAEAPAAPGGPEPRAAEGIEDLEAVEIGEEEAVAGAGAAEEAEEQLGEVEEEEEIELVVEGEEEAPPAAPTVPETVEEAAAAIAAGAPGRAAAFLEEHLGEHPEDGRAARLLTDARRAQGGGAALRDAFLRLAGIERRAGNLEEARLACQDALAADPRSSAAALTLAQIVVEEERVAQAAAAPTASPSPSPPAEPVAGTEEEVDIEIVPEEEPGAAWPADLSGIPSPDLGLEAAQGIEEAEPASAEAPPLEQEPAVAELALDEVSLDEAPPAGEGPAAAEPALDEVSLDEAPAVEEPPAAEEPALEEVSLDEARAPVASPPPEEEVVEEVELGEAPPAEPGEAEEAGVEEVSLPLEAAPSVPEQAAGPAAGAPEEVDVSAPEYWADLAEAVAEAPAGEAAEAAPTESSTGIGEDLDAFDVLEEAAPVGVAPEPPPAVPQPAGAEAGGAGEVDEFLAEADFYFQQGLLDEAEFLYRKLLRLAPGRTEIAEQLGRLEAVRREAHAEAAPPAPPPPAGEAPAAAPPLAIDEPLVEAGGIDFSGFIDDLRQEIEATVAPGGTLVEEPAEAATSGEEGLNEIFQEFQRNVREQLGEEDFETHYNLGIAYKEMGLMEEALGEFALAERSPSRRPDALSMVALCLREMGRLDDAAAKLSAAVAEVPEGSDQQKGFLYDLAGIHEQAGRAADAQEALRRVVAIDPGYRDAAARLQATAPPARKKPRVGYL